MKPTDGEFFQAANAVINQRGYLVIGYSTEWSVLPTDGIVHKFGQFPSPAPLRIVAETNAADWTEQLRYLRELMFEKYNGPRVEEPQEGRFFRVVTD